MLLGRVERAVQHLTIETLWIAQFRTENVRFDLKGNFLLILRMLNLVAHPPIDTMDFFQFKCLQCRGDPPDCLGIAENLTMRERV